MATPNINYTYNEFNGLSYSKVKDLVLKNGFQIFESFADGYYVAGVDVVKGNEEQCSTPWFNENGQFWLPYNWQAYACPVPWSEDLLQRGNTDTLMGDLPVGMTGTYFTDGSNFLLLAKYPGSDKIEYSKTFYNTLDTSAGFKIGMMVVKGILGMVTSGLAPAAIAVFDAQNPTPVIRPIDLTPPDSARDDLAPIDATPSPLPGDVLVPGVSEPETEPVAEPAKSNISLLLAIGAAILLG